MEKNKSFRLFSVFSAILCFASSYFYIANSRGIEIDFSSPEISGFNWPLGLCGASTLIMRCFLVLFCLNGLLILFFQNRPDLAQLWRQNNHIALGLLVVALLFSFSYPPIAMVLLLSAFPAFCTVMLYTLVSKRMVPVSGKQELGWTNLICVLTAFVLGGGIYAVNADLLFHQRGTNGNAVSGSSDFSSFSTVDFEGNPVTENIFSGHKLTLINVWGTFCGPCIIEMPELEALQNAYPADEVQVIGLCSDVTDKYGNEIPQVRKDADRILKQTGVTYRNIYPSEELQNGILRKILGVPTTFFVDENGTIVNTAIGARSQKQWTNIVEAQRKVLPQ